MTSKSSTAPGIELADADIDESEVIVVSADNKLEDKELYAKGKKGRRKCLCLACLILTVAIVLCLYFLYPRRIQACVKLEFGAEVFTKLEGDFGTYNIKVKNENYYPLDITHLEFGAYYGKRTDDKQLLNAEIEKWNIGSLESSSRDENYVYTQTVEDAGAKAEIYACFMQQVETVSFNVSAKMTGCMLGSCADVENHEIVYTLNCMGGEGSKGCLDYTKNIF